MKKKNIISPKTKQLMGLKANSTFDELDDGYATIRYNMEGAIEQAKRITKAYDDLLYSEDLNDLDDKDIAIVQQSFADWKSVSEELADYWKNFQKKFKYPTGTQRVLLNRLNKKD